MSDKVNFKGQLYENNAKILTANITASITAGETPQAQVIVNQETGASNFIFTLP